MLAALTKLQAGPARVATLQAHSERFLTRARAAGLDTGENGGSPSVPVMTGSGMRALALSHKLLEQGIPAHPISYPAVPEDKSACASSSAPAIPGPRSTPPSIPSRAVWRNWTEPGHQAPKPRVRGAFPWPGAGVSPRPP